MRGVLHVNIIEPVSEKMHNQREVTDTILVILDGRGGMIAGCRMQMQIMWCCASRVRSSEMDRYEASAVRQLCFSVGGSLALYGSALVRVVLYASPDGFDNSR